MIPTAMALMDQLQKKGLELRSRPLGRPGVLLVRPVGPVAEVLGSFDSLLIVHDFLWQGECQHE